MKKRLDFNQRVRQRAQLDNCKNPFDKWLGIKYTDPMYINTASKKNKTKKANRR